MLTTDTGSGPSHSEWCDDVFRQRKVFGELFVVAVLLYLTIKHTQHVDSAIQLHSLFAHLNCHTSEAMWYQYYRLTHSFLLLLKTLNGWCPASCGGCDWRWRCLLLSKGFLPLCPLVRSVRRPGCLPLHLLSSPPPPLLLPPAALLLLLLHLSSPLPLPPLLPVRLSRLPAPAKVIMYVSGCAGQGGREVGSGFYFCCEAAARHTSTAPCSLYPPLEEVIPFSCWLSELLSVSHFCSKDCR